MTEAEWLECDDPLIMLRHRNVDFHDRKAYLLTAESIRRVRTDISERFQKWGELYYQAADHPEVYEKTEEEWHLIEAELYELDQLESPPNGHGKFDAVLCIIVGAWNNSGWLNGHYWQTGTQSWHEERKAHAQLIRELYGNPFRESNLDREHVTPTILAMAQDIYHHKSFDSLPILADALEEAGCTDQPLLDHCRQPGDHVRGCWVVDLLLGKS